MTQLEQVNAIHRFLKRLFVPGDLIEIRGLKSDRDGTLCLLTDDFFLAAKTASGMEKLGADVYFCLNPISRKSKYAQRALINYPARRVPIGYTAGNADIANRNAYLVDIDPKRPSGEAATEEQRGAAMATAQQVRTFLTERGWTEPLVLDSGNGVHLLFKGNRCSADDSALKFALKALDRQFGGTCKIDIVVSNPARISRMPFCLNRKAGRRARVVSMPTTFGELMPWLVLRLAEEHPAYAPPAWSRSSSSSSSAKGTLLLDEDGVLDLIDEFPDQLELDGDPAYKGEATYFALASCPFKGGPHRGQSVGIGKTVLILWPDSIGFKCFSDDCCECTFSKLLHLLYAQTGRWPSMPIWQAEDPADLDARWGGVDDVTECAAEPVPVSLEEFITLLGGPSMVTVGDYQPATPPPPPPTASTWT